MGEGIRFCEQGPLGCQGIDVRGLGRTNDLGIPVVLLNYDDDVCWRRNLGKRRLGKDGEAKRWNRNHAKKGNPANWGNHGNSRGDLAEIRNSGRTCFQYYKGLPPLSQAPAALEPNRGQRSGSRSFDLHLLDHYVLRRPVLAIAWDGSDFVHYVLPLHDLTKDRMFAG